VRYLVTEQYVLKINTQLSGERVLYVYIRAVSLTGASRSVDFHHQACCARFTLQTVILASQAIVHCACCNNTCWMYW